MRLSNFRLKVVDNMTTPQRSGGKWNLFATLTDELINTIAASCQVQQFGSGACIYRRGDQSTALYQVITGRVLMRTYSSEGKELLYVHMEPGDCFGELGLIDGKPCHHDADAGLATTCLRIDRIAFLKLRQQYPEFQEALLQFLARRTRAIYATIEDAFLLDVPRRLARRLYDMFQQRSRAGLDPVVTCTHEDLAKMIGSTRQSVSSILKDWERDGWLEQSYNTITLGSLEQLRSLVEV